MTHDDQDDLWNLLGRAWTPSVSPMFSRNVVREVRALRPPSGFLVKLVRYWQLPAMAACALAIVAGAMFNKNRGAAPEDRQLTAIAEKVSVSPDYRVIGNLDELLDSEQNSVWLAVDLN